MNIYTSEELTGLIKELLEEPRLNNSNCLSIKSGSNSIFVTEQEFISLVFLDPILNPLDFIKGKIFKETAELIKMRKFIYEVPFYQVPLYMNIYDDIAAWRLRIDK